MPDSTPVKNGLVPAGAQMMSAWLVFNTVNLVYKFKKSENFEKRCYNANGNANI